jgi:hypothetical protein
VKSRTGAVPLLTKIYRPKKPPDGQPATTVKSPHTDTRMNVLRGFMTPFPHFSPKRYYDDIFTVEHGNVKRLWENV